MPSMEFGALGSAAGFARELEKVVVVKMEEEEEVRLWYRRCGQQTRTVDILTSICLLWVVD